MDSIPDVPRKCCTKCGVEKEATLENFYKSKSCKYGVTSECKVCKAAYQQTNRLTYAATYRVANRDKINEYAATYRAVNRENKKAYNKAWHAANRERQLAYSAEWYQANRERQLAYRAEYYRANREHIIAINKAYREANPEKVSATNKAYYEANREIVAARYAAYQRANPEKMKAKHARRRARRNASIEHFTAQDLELQYRSQRGKCWHCGIELNENYHADHLIPLAQGGSNAPNNIVCSCAPCNLSKHDKTVAQWKGRLF